jgi:hypothetical protein
MKRLFIAVLLCATSLSAVAQIPVRKPSTETHECYYQPKLIDGCGLSVNSVINIYGCEVDGYYYNVHRVLLQPGITYTFIATAQSSSFSPHIGVSHEDSDVFFARNTGPRGGSATVTYSPPTDDFYEIFLGPAERVATGTIRLTSTCQYGTTPTPQPSCVPSATDVCLQNGRFRVSATYTNHFVNPPQPGNFLAGKLVAGVQNPDVATFGISSAQAIEVVVRIQDARPFGINRFDVYYGGLTDLQYNITVTDTVKNVTRSYFKSAGTITGGVDRTSFVAN